MERTPWPIELHNHPFGSIKKGGVDPIEITNGPVAEDSETSDLQDPLEIARDCFEHPRLYRDKILERVAVTPAETYNGGNVFYMWMNKTCPVGCEFCFFRSPERSKDKSKTEITDEGIARLIQFTEDGKIDKFVVSGGGEPTVCKNKVNILASKVNAETFTVVTSAYWSRKKEKTDEVLSNLYKAAKENPHNATAIVRLSLDEHHLERIARGKGFGYIQNLIDWFAENAPNDPHFKLLIHTMEGDKTVEELLTTLPIESRVDQTKHLNRKTQVTLRNGLTFNVEYSQIFDSNPEVDLRDEKKLAKNTQTFHDFIDQRRNGNMSLSFHGNDQPKGVYFLTLYDGTTIIWGATSPDVETTIYKDDYATTMKKNLNDVITLGALEKGPYHMQDLVTEVDPKAVERAVGVGLRDFYTRLLLEEDKTRLYVSLRLIQEYIADGRIHSEQIKSWPARLQTLITLDPVKLKEICIDARYNIVQQYLDDPKVSAETLLALYKLVRLGHYAITPEAMHRQVMESNVNVAIKDSFKDKIALLPPLPAAQTAV